MNLENQKTNTASGAETNQVMNTSSYQEDSYSQEGRTFGRAIKALKDGYKVAREGWNGKNMFIYLNKGNIAADNPTNNYKVGGCPIELFTVGDFGTSTRMPNLNMKAADGSTVTGWLASQTDILSEDWTIVE